MGQAKKKYASNINQDKNAAQKKVADEKTNNVIDFKSKADKTTETLFDKAEIERVKRLLTEKIKDPKLAKKAAMILSEMLNPKK